jgi:RNase H-fold protein (predicted Holliday junction resolvase)
MTIMSPNDFIAVCQPGQRLMALDVGAKTIGLATHVWGTETVMPLGTIARVKFSLDAAALANRIRDYDVRGLVVGWPLLPDGTAGKRCQSVYDFTQELDRFLTPPPLWGREGPKAQPWEGEGIKTPSGIPITFQDERFSTAHGDNIVDTIGKTAGKSVRHRRDAMIDSLAAQRILETFLGL